MAVTLISLLNIAIFQGAILGVVILRSPLFKSNANKYLAYAIFSLSISLLNQVLEDMGMYNSVPASRIVDIIDPGLLFPTFIFLYIVHQVNHPIKDSNKNRWLYFPYFFALINDILDEIGTSIFSQENHIYLNMFLILYGILNFIIVLIYIPAVYIYAYSFIKYSQKKMEKKWLTRLWFLACFLFISWLTIILSGLFIDAEVPLVRSGLTVFASFLILWNAYFGIYKFRLATDREAIQHLFNKDKVSSRNPIIKEQPKPTHQIKDEILTKDNLYFQKLEDLCNNEKIYRDSSIDRNKVAEYLGISPGYVSQLINTITGDNFTTYINRYRVEAVKTLILDPEFNNYSLLAIGLECGFSSKTTFYNSFKKMTGITPNAFRKMHQ